MNFLRKLVIGGVIAALSGCGGAAPIGPPGAIPQSAAPRPLAAATAQKKRGDSLLYVSSVNNCDVYVFAYPRGKIEQTIDVCNFGFGPAFGLCTDRAGNIFMNMGAGFSVFKFAHGGSQPIGQLESASQLPVGCSVDSITGDLAVANVTGTVSLYKDASGYPSSFSLAGIEAYYFCTFDGHGNLFIGGEDTDGGYALAELPKGKGALLNISINAKIAPGYGLQWDGKYLAIGAGQTSNGFVIDRVHVSKGTATVVSTTTLDAGANNFIPVQFWIQGKTIIQPQADNAQIGFWNYPAGGAPKKSIGLVGSMLSGVTVSRVGGGHQAVER